jgi:hypothetical protein
VRPQGLGKFKKFIHFIGSRISDIPACSVVLQPLRYSVPRLRCSECLIKCHYMCSDRLTSTRNIKDNEMYCPKQNIYNYKITCISLGVLLHSTFICHMIFAFHSLPTGRGRLSVLRLFRMLTGVAAYECKNRVKLLLQKE